MTLLLPTHVANRLKRQEQQKPRVGGYEANSKHYLETDDFITPDQVAEQVAEFLAYEGTVPKPVGWRVSCLVLTIPETSQGGVIMVDDHRESRALSSPQGIILALGPNAYRDPSRFEGNSPWVTTGDRVLFQKYGGRMFQLSNGQHICFLNDTEFAGVLDRGWINEGE